MKEVVIKIPDGAYNGCLKLKSNKDNGILGFCLINAVANGIELSKGHKELIDTKELIQDFVKAEENMKGNGVTPVFDVHEITNMILSQEVIIEADKGDTE